MESSGAGESVWFEENITDWSVLALSEPDNSKTSRKRSTMMDKYERKS